MFLTLLLTDEETDQRFCDHYINLDKISDLIFYLPIGVIPYYKVNFCYEHSNDLLFFMKEQEANKLKDAIHNKQTSVALRILSKPQMEPMIRAAITKEEAIPQTIEDSIAKLKELGIDIGDINTNDSNP